MWNCEPMSSGIDPDETQPGLLQQPLPRRPIDCGTAWAVDKAAPDLARLCAGWALRGRSVEDLVGLVSHCGCRPKVFPRCALSSRFGPGETLDALREIRTQRGRLAVVETWADPRTEERPRYAGHHIVLPGVAVPDSDGHLEPLSTELRDLLDRCLEPVRPGLRGVLVKDLLDHHTRDALYLSADYLESGGAIHLHRRDDALSEDRVLLDAAEYETMPGKLLCIVLPQRVWQKNAAAWLDLEQLGLRLERDSCFETTYLYDEFKASLP